MNSNEDLNEPDECRPAKRTRFEAPLDVTEDTRAEMADDDDWDDVYGANEPGASVDLATHTQSKTPVESAQASSDSMMLDAGQPLPNPGFQPPVSQHQSDAQADQAQSSIGSHEPSIEQKCAEDMSASDDLVAPIPPVESLDSPSTRVLEQNVEVEMPNADGLPTSANANSEEVAPTERGDGLLERPAPKAPEDPEFLAAAAAQKDNKEAEWRFDSSDAESSSDSDSSDSSDDSDDSDSEGGYELLDPVTAARMLMSGDGDDDDGERGKGKSDYQPRTANEKQEEVVPKPDVAVTPDMKITFLGTIERAVDNLILIKGATPGEYQVLEGGSVLCTEDRSVIGAVAETLGRVQEPMYSVMFSNSKEIEDAGLSFGSKIFYVDSHSTFVFTQPLKNLKGTDASNIHDEEVGEDEIEFSDDETEAEYKRQRKLAKKAGRGGLSRGDFNDGVRISQSTSADGGPSYSRGNDAPAQSYGGGMSYDDEPADEFYMPLKRPDNLSQLMAGRGPGPQQPSFDRGRGRGGFRSRGRGDRGGGGRGGGDNRHQRGGRGGGGQHNNMQSHRGNAQSFPDRHNSNNDESRYQKHSLPPKPIDRPQAGPSALPNQDSYQQPAPQSYNFNGYTFQFGNYGAPAPPQQQQQGYHAAQTAPGAPSAIPPGSYVNPAFAHMQQYQQQPPAQQRQSYAGWNHQQQQHQQHQQQQQYPQYQYQPQAPPNQQPQQPPQQQTFPPDISEILKNLGAQRQQ